MKDFIEELKYCCSADNTTSRGLYIFIAIALVALLIADPVMLVLLIVNLVKYKAFKVMWLVLFVAITGILIGLIVWLKKS